MKSRLLTTVALIGAVSSISSFAKAADIIEEPYFPPPAPVVEEVATGGWYLRGDVGYAFKSKTDGYYNGWNIDPGVQFVDDVFHYDSIETQGAATFGVGVGYRFNDFLRADATVDYFKADLEGSSNCNTQVQQSYNILADAGCHYKDTSEVAIWTALANAYVDLGSYGGITPYVGAGLGFAHVKYDDMRNEIVCGSNPNCPTDNYVGFHAGESSWRFASSLSAGASIDISRNLKFDAGYRYTRISGGDAFGYDEMDRTFGASGVQGSDNGFDIHAVRAGLRYEFGGGGGDGFGFGKGKGKGPEPVYASTPLYEEPAPLYEEPIYK